ncbi:hypothetical protein AGMMS49574_03870 [Bacteroidia bacterium]|nr:hypothetical protein AGMMS49574_03870 [Bacteroidia bacterium]
MGTFKSVKTFYAPVSMIPGIADEITTVLSGEGYEVKSDRLIGGGYDISIRKGDVFKAVLGMKTALKVDIHPTGNSIYIEASVGIFGQQAIPTVISMFFLWPVLLTQIWGLIQQSKLDDRVIDIAEVYISRNQSGSVDSLTNASSGKFCTSCGKRLANDALFCSGCGNRL